MTRFLLRAIALFAAVAAAVAAPALARQSSASAKPVANQGIVDIDTTLGYEQSEAAGTGIVVTSSGEVLTNNHVIKGATKISVVDVVTHKRYAANVVGYDVADDIAVLDLVGASGLATAPLGSSSSLKIGQLVRAIGNAGGRGGVPSIATGTISALNQRITASDESNGTSENLTKLIATTAAVEPGDSGGPLVNASGRVIGIVTAGSSGFAFQASSTRGFAIPINKVRALAKQIVAGNASKRIHVGETAFLGISIDAQVPGGAEIAGVLPDSAAEKAGVETGDLITSLNGVPLGSASDLQSVVLTLKPGKPVPLQWEDQFGTVSSGTITPASGPPQ
jgi:S1-C subfamily serine protease